VGVLEIASCNSRLLGDTAPCDLGQKGLKKGQKRSKKDENFYATLNSRKICLKHIDKFRINLVSIT